MYSKQKVAVFMIKSQGWSQGMAPRFLEPPFWNSAGHIRSSEKKDKKMNFEKYLVLFRGLKCYKDAYIIYNDIPAR